MGVESQSAFERRARQAFDASVEALDGRTRSRLTQARHAALAQAGGRPGARWFGVAPLAGVSAALVAALLLWPRAPEIPPGNGTVDDEFEIALAGDDLDLVSEDLAFYALVETQAAGPGGGVG